MKERWADTIWLRANCEAQQSHSPKQTTGGTLGSRVQSAAVQQQQQYCSTAHLAGVLVENEPRLLEAHAGSEPRGHAPHLRGEGQANQRVVSRARGFMGAAKAIDGPSPAEAEASRSNSSQYCIN